MLKTLKIIKGNLTQKQKVEGRVGDDTSTPNIKLEINKQNAKLRKKNKHNPITLGY